MGKLQLRLRRQRIVDEQSEGEAGELSLIPFLDIITNLLLFLMATAGTAAAFSEIPIRERAYGPPIPPILDDRRAPIDDLLLTVHVSAAGFTVATSGGTLYRDGVPGRLPTIPRAGRELDPMPLTRAIRAIKDSVAANGNDDRRVVITADPQIPYEDVVEAIDAVRRDSLGVLFPEVCLAAGVEPR